MEKWLKIALEELGQGEIYGPKANERIIDYHRTTKLKSNSDEIPWCSSFCNWVFEQCGIEGTDSAMARSWVKWGQKILKPIEGCIVVVSRGTNPALGHVGFYIGNAGKGLINILGGNQGNKVSIQAFPVSKVVAYRWPNNIDIPEIGGDSNGKKEKG